MLFILSQIRLNRLSLTVSSSFSLAIFSSIVEVEHVSKTAFSESFKLRKNLSRVNRKRSLGVMEELVPRQKLDLDWSLFKLTTPPSSIVNLPVVIARCSVSFAYVAAERKRTAWLVVTSSITW